MNPTSVQHRKIICKTTVSVCESWQRKKKAPEEITPFVRMKGQGWHGGKVDGSAVKSYFSGLRELWRPTPVGPLLEPAQQEAGPTCELQ